MNKFIKVKKHDQFGNMSNTTIVSCSTGFPGAIAVIRLSGAKTIDLLNDCFLSKTEIAPRLVRTGKIAVSGLSDTATAVFFKSPDSYTGEDMAEISVHANQILVQKILMFLIKNGAEGAKKGEYTYRAFLNGKMDLSAAEAVADIINAESESEIKYAYRQMKGEIRQKVESIQEALLNTLAGINAAIDFPEENIEDETLKEVENSLLFIKNNTKQLLDTYQRGKFIKNGVKVAIIGSVNVGKSSLLNALLKKDRAIVTGLAGTTRDTLEDVFEYNGQKFIITDTAGIRKSKNVIEAEGIERSKAAAWESDVVLAVTEAGKEFDSSVKDLLESLKKEEKNIIYIENKTDIFMPCLKNAVGISAKTQKNIEELKQRLYKTALGEETNQEKNEKYIITDKETAIIIELRHYQALIKVMEYLNQTEESIKNGQTPEIIALNLLEAYNGLGIITGKAGADGIIDTIFSRFCVGK